MSARILKRKRTAISYREPETDEELFDESEEERLPRKKPTTPQRRSARCAAASYKEPSTDEDLETDSEAHVASARPRVRDRSRLTRSSKPSPRKVNSPKPKQKQSVKPKGVGVLGAPVKHRTKPTPIPFYVISDGNTPPWHTLPYHIQLQIFVYAAHDENLDSSSAVSWLWHLVVAFPCFREAALTALYRNPPISTLDKARRIKLVQLLSEAPSDHRYNYQVMVKRLELDATQLSTITAGGQGTKDLVALVMSLKTLQDIDIFDPFDRPPYRRRDKSVRWQYPDELFAALRQHTLEFKNWIKRWRWNASFCMQGLLWIKEINGEDAFTNLEDITYTNFNEPQVERWTVQFGRGGEKSKVPVLADEDDQPTSEGLLASGLCALSRLKSLTFESCDVVNGNLLPLLPHGLSSLNFTNCGELDGAALHTFLLSHGSRLKHLTLNHNQSLDISFLVDLKRSCPRLESLRMDLNYYNSFSTARDSDPKFDELLGEEEVPSWPATLRIIEMEYLRKWTAKASENFFNSLLESAEELPDLRELTLTATLQMGWRDRAEYRQALISRFRRVFLRKLTPPNPHFASMRAYREWRMKQTSPRGYVEVIKPAARDSETNPAVLDSDSDTPILLSRKAKAKSSSKEAWSMRRLRRRGGSTPAHTESSDDSPALVKEAPKDTFIQGRCRLVDIRVDNLRPREEIWSEGDFLDPEASGDEDWNGEDLPTDEEVITL